MSEEIEGDEMIFIKGFFIALCVVAFFMITMYHPTGTKSKSGLYTIDACPTCECRIIRYSGGRCTLGCIDVTGHFTQVEVLNHQVHKLKGKKPF